MKINITEIMGMIPHRYPFLLVDRVLELQPDGYIIGIKNVTFNEPHFTGHFPGKPIMPGVLIIEAMAQLSAILVAKSMQWDNPKDKEVLFLAIEEAKFRKPVEPGDALYMYAKIEQNRGHVWKFSSNSKVNDQIVAESNFTAMVKDRN